MKHKNVRSTNIANITKNAVNLTAMAQGMYDIFNTRGLAAG